MDIQQLMKQAQKMQRDAEKMDAELKEKVYVGTAGGEAVKIEMDGGYTVKSIQIEDGVSEDKEMLIEMLTLALNQVLESINEDKEDSMSSLTKGMSLPGVF